MEKIKTYHGYNAEIKLDAITAILYFCEKRNFKTGKWENEADDKAQIFVFGVPAPIAVTIIEAQRISVLCS